MTKDLPKTTLNDKQSNMLGTSTASLPLLKIER
jgi:hypothetical protein